MNKQISKKLTEIAAVLQKDTITSDNINLMGGKAGIALFFFYYSKLTNKEEYADIGFKMLSDAFEEINKGFNYHTFSGGIAGVGWTVEHLVQNGFLEPDTREVLDDLDDFVFKTMMTDIRSVNYDFLHGAIGNGTYFLSRLQNSKTKAYLTQLVDDLEKLSETGDNGAIKWISVLNRDEGVKGYNISLSHGIASIIAFLSTLYEKKIHEQKVLTLLTGAIKYLLQQQLDTKKHNSVFPGVAIESQEPADSRLAWCYGDLGIGMALWKAARSTRNKEWENKAIDVLLRSTKRKDLQETRLIDAGLCHGTAGVAHIYNRMYACTGIEEFKQSANYWFDETFKMARFDDGFAGYKAWRSEEHGGWANEAGLLEGIAGIGLALISAASDIEPKWDRCLLLS